MTITTKSLLISHQDDYMAVIQIAHLLGCDRHTSVLPPGECNVNQYNQTLPQETQM